MSRRVAIALIAGSLGVVGPLAGPSPASSGLSSGGTTGAVWRSVSPGKTHTCGIQRDGTMWCWGENNFGQLGVGDEVDRAFPTQVGTETNWALVGAGDDHTCAVRTNHTLWCWGDNYFDELGLGEGARNLYTMPVEVGTDTDWASVSAGRWPYTCGIRLDHTLWCWGANHDGVLGVGDTKPRSIPTQVGTDADWALISPNRTHTCGARIDHTVWCWGENEAGQLGVGDTTDRKVPVQVAPGGARWKSVATGDRFTCGTRLGGTLWCWGYNDHGQLGQGDFAERHLPSQVGTETDWAYLSAHLGHGHACAIRTDHSLWCWGHNRWGQLGLGDQLDRNRPTQVGTVTTWSRVIGGDAYTCATRRVHHLFCWGANFVHQLGIGGVKRREVPTRV